MAGIAHIAFGFAAKRVVPQAPLAVLLVASEAIDILWGGFALVGMDSMESSPWSHGLFMSTVWSVGAGLLAGWVFRSRRTGIVTGLVVFSHWLLDFITHPMTGGPPNLPLLFAGTPRIGLGLYTAAGLGFATVFELGLVLAGVLIYLSARKCRPLAAS